MEATWPDPPESTMPNTSLQLLSLRWEFAHERLYPSAFVQGWPPFLCCLWEEPAGAKAQRLESCLREQEQEPACALLLAHSRPRERVSRAGAVG